MRVSTSAITASLTLTFLATTETLGAGTPSFVAVRDPRPFQSNDLTAFDTRPLELHPILGRPEAEKITRLSKPTKIAKHKKYRRKARRRVRRISRAVPLPPRIVRSRDPRSTSEPSRRGTISFNGVKLGLDIETSLESRIDPTPYGALVPFPSAPPTRPLTLLTLRSFAGIDKEIDSTVIGVEAGLGYRFTHSARSIGTVPTFGPSGLDASVSARFGTIIDGRLLYGTAGIAVANFTTNTQRLHHDRLYGGLTVGVGLEQHLTPTLLLRAEYFYRQFPAARFQSHNFRIGVGIRF